MTLTISQLTHKNSISSLNIEQQRHLTGGLISLIGIELGVTNVDKSKHYEQNNVRVEGSSMAINGENNITIENYYPA